MKPRSYQVECIQKIQQHIINGTKNILLVCPTGGGKTYISSVLVQWFVENGLRVCFLVDRDNLISQTIEEYKYLDVDIGLIKAGFEEDRGCQIQIASVQTLNRRDWWQKEYKIDVFIADECHELAYTSAYQKAISTFPNSIFLGMTATPYRMSSKESLRDFYDVLVQCPAPRYLMDLGYLVQGTYYTLDHPDLEGVSIQKGDYKSSDLTVRCNTPELIKKAYENYQSLTPGKRFIGFCVDVAHAEACEKYFESQGILCDSITAKTSTVHRNFLYNELRRGKVQGLFAVNCLSKGFNVVEIETIILMRPTKSRALHEQQLGRGFRISPHTGKKTCYVLDMAGNMARHPFVEHIKKYVIHPSDADGESDPPPMKECVSHQYFSNGTQIKPSQLGLINSYSISNLESQILQYYPDATRKECKSLLYGFQMTCPNCEYEFEPPKKESHDGSLIHFVPKGDKIKFNFFRLRCKRSFERNYSPLYAFYQYKDKYGENPPVEWYYGAVFDYSVSNSNLLDYMVYLKRQVASQKIKKEDVKKFMGLEFGLDWEKLFIAAIRSTG